MKKLLKNGRIVNVFTDTLEGKNVLLEDGKIIGVGEYSDSEADEIEDIKGKFVCPGFIDGHIHIESSMLQPSEFARVCLKHGTTSVIADPHEIANVAGLSGIEYMLEASEGIPMGIYYMVPSCVPATSFDEAGAELSAEDIKTFFTHPRVLGLGEMMNYPGVITENTEVVKKIDETLNAGLLVNGHAPLLLGKDLDKYIAHGIFDDHECSNIDEAMEKLRKGQIVMIRQGTAAKNLNALLPLFDEPYSRRCILVTDDKNSADLLKGHINNTIREAVKAGKSPITGIRMATLQAAEHYGLHRVGAVAPGYFADILVLNDLDSVDVSDVYYRGEKVVSNGETLNFKRPEIRADIWKTVYDSFHMPKLTEDDFKITPNGNLCRVIQVIPGELIKNEQTISIDFEKNNGIDVQRDILKIAVIERHKNTGHIGLGFISGTGMKKGAIASSVSHDSHNLIIIGTNHNDMMIAANRIRELGGGLAAVEGGKILAEMPLPIGGLMGVEDASVMAEQNEFVHAQAQTLGAAENVELFMNMAFVSLSVIPDLALTTKGLIDVKKQEPVSLFVQ